MTSPEPSSHPSSLIYDLEGESEATSVDLRQLLAAPGWHIDPPSAATKLGRPVREVEPQAENLEGFDGGNWIPPALPAGEEVVAVITVAPRSHRGRKIVKTVAIVVGVTAGLAFSLHDAKRPPLAATAAPTSPTKTLTPVSVPPYEPLAIDGNAVVMAAQRLKITATPGVRIDNAQTQSADPRVLDYLFAITPESVMARTPDLLHGASNTHVTASSSAANVAALRLDNPSAAKEALDNAIDGEYKLDLWFNRAGNLIRLTVYTADSASNGRIEVTFAEPVQPAPVTVPSVDQPFVDENAPSETIPEPPTSVPEATTPASAAATETTVPAAATAP